MNQQVADAGSQACFCGRNWLRPGPILARHMTATRGRNNARHAARSDGAVGLFHLQQGNRAGSAVGEGLPRTRERLLRAGQAKSGDH